MSQPVAQAVPAADEPLSGSLFILCAQLQSLLADGTLPQATVLQRGLAAVADYVHATGLLWLQEQGALTLAASAHGDVLADDLARLTTLAARWASSDAPCLWHRPAPQFPPLHESWSALAVAPMRLEGQTLGLLMVVGRDVLAADTLALLCLVAELLAQNVARSRAEARFQQAHSTLEQQNERLTALYRASQILNSTLEPDTILDRLTDEATQVTHATHGQVLVVHNDAGCFERRSLRGFSPEEAKRARTAPLPLDQGLNGRAYQSLQPVRMDDARAERSYFPLIATTRSELVVPIVRDGEVLGNLDLQSPAPYAFAEVDLDYLKALADQVAIALTNARAFRALAQAKQDWESTFNAMHDSVVLVDEQGQLLHTNRAFGRFATASRPDQVSALFAALGPCLEEPCTLLEPPDAPASRCLHEHAGHLYDVQRNPVAAGGGGRRVMVLRDVTTRKRAEAELRALAARLEQSNQELQDFASVASHDLQEPLRKIQAFGDRLRAKHGALLPTDGLDYLERMQSAAGRMQTLINDLLSYSRVTTRAQPFVAVDLSHVVADVLSDLEVRVEQVQGTLDIGPLPIVEAEPLQMQQLFQNLLGNALKYHRPAVPPHIVVNSQRCAVALQGAHWEIRVQDNGIGFDEKYLDRIFAPFQRLHSRYEFEGTGMGLAVCRKIIQRHEGTLTATSTPGQGSTFIITLPERQNPPSEAHPGPA